MSDNSGFLNDSDNFSLISSSFSNVVIIGRSATNVYGRTDRFGKRWFFKGAIPDIPDARQRLLKEFEIQIGLVHPSIARVVSFENIEGIGECIITEWIEGATLEECLANESLSFDERKRIFTEIVNALSYIHSQGIVHRDLKPSNIIIRKNGQSAVIIDFGLADTDAYLYQKSPAGTEGYASHRQHFAHTPYTGDDIHALGVILRQMCPELSSIAKHCISGRFSTTDTLRSAILQHNRRKRILLYISGAVIFISIISSLLIYIASLQNKTTILQRNIEAMTDSVVTLRAVSLNTNTALRDSISIMNRQLDKEMSMRRNHEQRQLQFNELKNNLNQLLDTDFAAFRKAENPTDPDNLSMLRLIDRLNLVKTNFINNDIPFTLSDSELSELEYSYITHYNKILQQWNQIRNQHQTINSLE